MRFVILLIGLCGVASAALLARYGLDAGLSATALSAWRLTLGTAGLVLFRLVFKGDFRLDKWEFWRVVVAGACLAIHFATWIASLAYTTVAVSTLLVSTSPLWTGLVGLAIPNLRPRPIFWLGLAVAGVGTALTAVTRSVPAPNGPPWVGYALATIGAICVVPYLILSQQVQRRTGTLTTITWMYGSAAAVIWIFLMVQGSLPAPATPRAWISVLGMTLFAQLIGHGLLNHSLKRFSAAQVSAATLLEPVLAGLLAWMFLAEAVPMLQIVGGLILLLGVALSLRGDIQAREPLGAE